MEVHQKKKKKYIPEWSGWADVAVTNERPWVMEEKQKTGQQQRLMSWQLVVDFYCERSHLDSKI